MAPVRGMAWLVAASTLLVQCFYYPRPALAWMVASAPPRRLPRLHSTPPSSSDASVSAMSRQMKDMRSEMEKDERTALMMQALRGSNIRDDVAAAEGLNMLVVETADRGDQLPLTYQPDALAAYFGKRPGAVAQRLFQVLSTSAGFLAGVAFDYALGRGAEAEVRRAAQLRDTITALGPFFIKLGQALSIRPDILSPRAMVELQQLCDKVPCFDSELAWATIRQELGKDKSELFSEITPEPVAAASLGQVYKATLRATGEQVAVKVQRPFVLETVSLDLHLARQLGYLVRNVEFLSSRLDLVALLDEFASRFYQELDYNLECANGVRIAEEMKKLPQVVIPRNYPEYTARRVHVAEWVDGEKLSQSTADDVGALVNLGVITYLTQLLDTGFFHADPHPGNMLRSPDGKLVILDFGLMTEITDDQKYGMIEAIAHLINRDYSEIGEDFVNLDFIPRGTDTRPIVPALARVFDAALAGGGAKSINFQELASDLAQITFQFPFRIPPYFALIIRAIGVLEGIALVGNPEFAIVDEAYPYISRRLLTDQSDRMRSALRYMIYGKEGVLDAERLIDLLQAVEKFIAVKDYGDGSAFKVDGQRGSVQLGSAGDFAGSRTVDTSNRIGGTGANAVLASPSPPIGGSPPPLTTTQDAASDRAAVVNTARDALRFVFSDEGASFREFMLDDIASGVDALSRDAARNLTLSIGARGVGGPSLPLPVTLEALAPKLTDQDRKIVESTQRLLAFLLGDEGGRTDGLSLFGARFMRSSSNPSTALSELGPLARELSPVMTELGPSMRQFGTQLAGRLTEKLAARLVRYTAEQVFGSSGSSTSPSPVTKQQDGRLVATV